jgi:uncharacterized protein (UPF0261 family)
VTETGTLVDLKKYINETMFGSGYENCAKFGVLGGVIFKLDICKQEAKSLFFGSVSSCTCLILL